MAELIYNLSFDAVANRYGGVTNSVVEHMKALCIMT
jgi:hypothetical protein